MLSYNTTKERKIYSFLQSKFNNLICPNRHIKSNLMSCYLKIVRWSDMVIVTDYKSKIGKGCYEEIQTADNYSIPVYFFKNQQAFPISLKECVVLNKDWKNYAKISI